MKRFVFVTVAFILSMISAHVLTAQDARLTIKMVNEPIVSIIDRIETDSGYSFIYTRQVLDETQRANLDVSDATLKETLNRLFEGTDIVYRVERKQIVLSRAENQTGEPVRMSGVVKNAADNWPLAGVAVFVDGSTTGTVTDLDGKFSINVPIGTVVSVNCLGFKEQKVTFNGKPVTVLMREDMNALEESVVVGYGTVSRKNLTTAIVSVKADEVQKSSNSNLNQLLMGRAAGLQATTATGQPDGKVNISIRGGGTPIYVVDGVVMPSNAISLSADNMNMPSNINRSGMNGINPSDIESIEVLKDASAAIYGVRAADGVILITTKKGAAGKPRVTYDGSYSFVRNYPYMETLNAQEYMTFANVFSKEGYLYNNKMYPYGGLVYDGGWYPVYSKDDIANAQTTDWTKFVLKNGYIQNHNLTVSGGTEHVKYYLSGQFYQQDGTVYSSGMDKFTVHANLSAQIFPFFNLTTSLNVNQNNYKNANVGADTGNRGKLAASALYAALVIPPYMSEKQADGSYTIYSDTPNPSSMREIDDKTEENGYNMTVTANIDLWKKYLTLKGVYGLNRENSQRNAYIPSTVYFDLMNKSRGNVHSQTRRHQTMEVMLSFQKEFADVVKVDALIGMGRYIEDYYGHAASYEDTNDAIRDYDIGSATGNVRIGSYKGLNEHRSQFFKAGMDVLDRYVLAFTLRRDGSDKFFPNQKYSFFPSVSFAWKLSNEKFLKDVPWLDLLKIRGSWGIVGTDNIGSSLYGTYSTTDFRVSFDGNQTYYIPYVLLGEDSYWVSWQKTYMRNIGLDFYVLDNRLSGSFDFFRNDVTRLLGTDATSPLAMLNNRYVNYGHFYRMGWEFQLNSVNIDRAFRWTSSLNLSRVNQVWKKRQDNYAYQQYQIRESEPLAAWYFYKVDGYINEDRSNMPEAQKSLPTAAQMPGYPIIQDKNNDGKITIDDVHMKNNIPEVYLGFGNTFSYKNFELDVYLYGQFGLYKDNVMLRNTNANLLSEDYPNNTSILAYRLWNSQTNRDGSLPGVAYGTAVTLPGNCGLDVHSQNASFVKVRNITFSYTFDEKVLGPKVGKWISDIKLYFDAQNPFTFTKYDGFDPELYMGGGGEGGRSVGEYPAVRSFSLGARLTF